MRCLYDGNGLYKAVLWLCFKSRVFSLLEPTQMVNGFYYFLLVCFVYGDGLVVGCKGGSNMGLSVLSDCVLLELVNGMAAVSVPLLISEMQQLYWQCYDSHRQWQLRRKSIVQ